MTPLETIAYKRCTVYNDRIDQFLVDFLMTMPVYEPQYTPSVLPSENTPQDQDPKEYSQSPWAKMFPEGATEEQVKTIVNVFINDLMCQMRKRKRHRNA